MIQKATAEHIGMLARAGIGVLSDLPNYAGVEFCPEHTEKMLSMMVGLPEYACFFEAVDGEVTGLYMAIIGPQWFTPSLELSEIMFWVRPDHRKTNLAIGLIKIMEEWALSKGAKRIMLAAGSGYETDRVVKFYNWLGYKSWSVITCKEF